MGSPVLLLMDYQVGICGISGLLGSRSGLSEHTERRDVLAKAGVALANARERGIPVIHVGVAFDSFYQNRNNRGAGFERFETSRWMLRGSQEAEFNPDVQPIEGEPVVFKGCVNPFIGTNLQEILIRQGATHLYLGGTATNYVVESTARHAGDLGYDVTVLEDLCASYNDEMHRFAIERTLPLFARIGTSADLPEAL
jgi:nicotinamidase-related amidase